MEKYQDFVIKQGQFIGQFKQLYQKFESPWSQNEISLSASRNMTVINLKRYKISSVLEYGCGLGYFSQMMFEVANCQIIGIDISETAIIKAKERFPHIDFKVGDIEQVVQFEGSGIDCILFPEITWYVLPKLDHFFSLLLKSFSGKYFFHNLVFYQNNTQMYGVEYFKNLDEFINYCPFKLVESVVRKPTNNDETIETHTVFKIEKK